MTLIKANVSIVALGAQPVHRLIQEALLNAHHASRGM
jgi:hypothetical protein